jgi:2-phosphoglycerate kinase
MCHLFASSEYPFSNCPKLILVSGATGVGKSTYSMDLALSKGIVKCISTDTIRQIMRMYDTSPALHRSSYGGKGDPVADWEEACNAVSPGIDSIINDSMKRGSSLILEGVHIIPSTVLINRWIENGGQAVGILLTISDQNKHTQVLHNRGKLLNKPATAQIEAISRIREIQCRMVSYATIHNWQILEQIRDCD